MEGMHSILDSVSVPLMTVCLQKSAPYSTDLTFERLPAYASRVSPETHWFMPRDPTDIENN